MKRPSGSATPSWAVEEVNFLEHALGGRVRVSGGRVRARFRPFEVKTLRVTR